MTRVRKYNLLILIFIICVISLFSLTYNLSVKNVISSVTGDNRVLLRSGTEALIYELQNSKSINQWEAAVKEFTEFEIIVEDSKNNVVAKNTTEVFSAEGITEVNKFLYKGEKYTVISSVYLFDGLSSHNEELIKFILTELIIALAAALVVIVLFYVGILRPYKAFYDSIEEYEKTGKTEKKSFSGYIGKVYNRFFALTQSIEQNENNQKRIIASISHDIKTPLTSIMGYAERLSKDNISEERKERYTNKIYTKAVEIRELVDEFDEYLGYSRSDFSGKQKMSLKELCRQFNNEYTDELASYAVAVKTETSIKDGSVLIDKKKFSRVFGNIIGNSVKHFNDTTDKQIRFTVLENKNEAVIKIADNGSGVSDENLKVIFEPFYTSDKGRKVAGLGLAICKEITESHGGRIYAQKSDMGGLEIIIKLPLVLE